MVGIRSVFLGFLLGFTTNLVQCQPLQTIDNGLEGEPEVECGEDAITVSFGTKQPFTGFIFVDGFIKNNACVAWTQGEGITRPNITVPFKTCGVAKHRTIRQAQPGINMSTTVIITFHPKFLTQTDRAVTVQCSYTEGGRARVSANPLDVKKLPADVITVGKLKPKCSYEVHEDGPNGTLVKDKNIGDKIYHRWICEVPDPTRKNDYCMLVHNCHVNDGNGDIVPIVGKDGCALDVYVLGNIEYLGDLEAGREAYVFRYADQSTVSFSCEIRLDLKKDGKCVTRPNCAPGLKGKRDVSRILTIDDPIEQLAVSAQSFSVKRHHIVDEIEEDSVVGGRGLQLANSQMCLQPWVLAIITCVALVTVTTTTALVTVGVMTVHRKRTNKR